MTAPGGSLPRRVVVGAGFGDLDCAPRLARPPVGGRVLYRNDDFRFDCLVPIIAWARGWEDKA